MASKSVLPTTPVRFAYGDGLNLGAAENDELSFRKYALENMSKPLVTREKFATYQNLGDAEQGRLKRSNGWTIRCHVVKGKRNKESVQSGEMITLDIDEATPQFAEDLMAGKILPGIVFAANTTRSHTPEKPRFRVALPTKTYIGPEDYQRACRIVAQMIDPDLVMVDKVSARVAQLMYRPSCSVDMEKYFRYHEQGGDSLDWEQVVEDWEDRTGLDSHDVTKLPKFKGEADLRDVADKVEDPLLKKGPVGYFNRAYSIAELVEGKDNEPGLLEGIYEVSEWDSNGEAARLTYIPGHSTNGVVIYNGGTLAYSHHGSDPACDKTLNAFDMTRYHLADAGDDDENEPMAKRASWKPMTAICKDLKPYRLQQNKEKYDLTAMALDTNDDDDLSWMEGETSDDLLGFDHLVAEERQKAAEADKAEMDDLLGVPVDSVVDIGESQYQKLRASKPPEDWIATKLELTLDGDIKPTLPNIATIITNDSRLWRKIAYNAFSNQIVQLADIKSKNEYIPDVVCIDKQKGTNWSDINDIVIRAIVEGQAGPGQTGYGFKCADRDLVGAVKLAARNNAFHPIRDLIEGWRAKGPPKTSMIDGFLAKHLGADDDQYTNDVMRMMMIASIARIETPGCKFDYACIIEGPQGIGKSTLIKLIYGEEYFGELDADLAVRKDVAEQIAGKWGMELPELSSFHKADHNHAKSFMRRQHDDVRLSYDRTTSNLPRQCVFWGTTNDAVYLQDPTGNRSYWVIKSTTPAIDFASVLRDREDLWCEAVYLHDQMRKKYPTGDLPLTLTGDSLLRAQELQEGARSHELWETWLEAVQDWTKTPMHLTHLQLSMGLNVDTLSSDEADRKDVLMVGFNQAMALTMAIGLKGEVPTHGPHSKDWNKVKARLELLGFEIPEDATRCGGQMGRWIFLPGVSGEDRKRGYILTDRAEPPETDDHDSDSLL